MMVSKLLMKSLFGLFGSTIPSSVVGLLVLGVSPG